MPVYQVVTSGIDLDPTQHDRLAQGITHIHHEETGAPDPFIRIVFMPLPLGAMYTAGEVAPSIIVGGGIRAGRSEDVRHALMRRIHDLVLEVTAVPVDQIVVVAQDVPNSWLMEAGVLLPEATPEAERAWMAELDALLPGKGYAQYA